LHRHKHHTAKAISSQIAVCLHISVFAFTHVLKKWKMFDLFSSFCRI